MNTSINFNPVNAVQANAKIAHVFRNHNLNKKRVSQEIEKIDDERGAIILQPYEKLTNFDGKKQGTSKITKNLAVYRKRYQIALEKGDLKTAERNKNKIDTLEKELQNYKRARRGREASLVEASWSITKFPPKNALNYDKDILIKMKNIALNILQNSFPELDINSVGVAGHIDQASIHIHTIFDVPDGTTFSKMIKNKTYGAFQQEFNNAIRQEFSGLPIEKITPNGKKYVPLLQYKKETNLDRPSQKGSENIHMQLKILQELNQTTKTENIRLREELEASRIMLREAQKALNKSKEQERINYASPLDRKEIQKALDEAPSGSLSSARLRLVRDGKLDFSKIEANTPEAQKIVENAKADFEALEAKGLLTCKDGIYRLKDDQARSVLYHMNDAKIEDITDEYASNKDDVYKRKKHYKNH